MLIGAAGQRLFRESKLHAIATQKGSLSSCRFSLVLLEGRPREKISRLLRTQMVAQAPV